MMIKPKVLILAAGRSARFWPLLDKSLFPFLGQPLIKHQIKRIKKAGFDQIVVVCNRKNRSSIQAFGVETIFQKGKGQAAAVLSAKSFLKGPVLIVNANDFFEPSLLKKVVRKGQEKETDACLVGCQVSSYFPGGYLVIDRKNQVKKIVEKPGKGQEPSDLVRLVVDYFKNGKVLLKYLKNGVLYEEALDQMAKDKVVRVVCYQAQWGYLKYPWHVLKMMAYFLSGIKKGRRKTGVKIAKNTTIQGPVILEKGVKVFENAKITGPTYIGEGTVVGNNVLVRESMIGKNCVLGYSTEVTRSYVGEDCWLHSNYIGDSVLDKNVSLGAGAVLANLRLDEKEVHSLVKGKRIDTQRTKLGAIAGQNVRIGVNTSIMPGIKIGKNSFIGAGVVLNKDLDEDKFCVLKDQNLVIKENIIKVKKGNREKFKQKLKPLK